MLLIFLEYEPAWGMGPKKLISNTCLEEILVCDDVHRNYPHGFTTTIPNCENYYTLSGFFGAICPQF